MGTAQDASGRRDRNTRFSNRLRAGVIGVGILSSLGLAGFLASAQNHPVVTAAASAQPATWVSGDDGEQEGGRVLLQPGTSGSAHAVTGGSTHVSSPAGQTGSVTSVNGIGLSSGNGSSHATTGGS
jgi:hypothetical protein